MCNYLDYENITNILMWNIFFWCFFFLSTQSKYDVILFFASPFFYLNYFDWPNEFVIFWYKKNKSDKISYNYFLYMLNNKLETSVKSIFLLY